MRYFDTWDAGIIKSTDAAGITYHPPSGHLFLSDSEINEVPEFVGDNIFEISLLGDAVFNEFESGNREPTGITYNQFDGYFYVTNDTGDKTLTRYDSNLNNPLLQVSTQDAVASAVDPEGVTADPSTGFLYVADGVNGGRQVLAYDSNLNFQYSFSVADRMADAEGIAFHAGTNHLFIVDGKDDQIIEYTLTGAFVAQHDISGFSPRPKAPQGLTWGPTSDPDDSPSALSIYVADGMKDNFPDGRVYEASIILAGNQPPTTSGIPSVQVNVDAPDTVIDLFAAFDDLEDADDDLSYTIEANSNPALFASTNIDGGQGTLTLDYAAGTIGTANITVRATDTGSPPLFVQTTFSVDVSPPNEGPTTTGIANVTAHEDAADTQIDLFASFADPEDADDEMTYTVEMNSNPGLFAATTINSSSGLLTLDYAEDANGTANIKVRATDTGFPVLYVETTFTVTVTEVNDQPELISGSVSNLTVLQNSGTTQLGLAGLGYGPGGAADENGQTLSYAVTNLPSPTLGEVQLSNGVPVAVGSYTLAQIQSMKFQAASGAVGGPEQFAFSVTDNGTTNGADDFQTLNQSLQIQITAEVLEIRVASGSDDAEERPTGSVKLTSGDLELIQDKTHQQTVGVRFNNVGIMPFSSIQSAYIQFQVDEVSIDPASLLIQGEASDNPPTFTSATANVSSRPRTSASVPWTPAPWPTKWEAGPDQRTADIGPIIQEIVNRPGWSSGNSLVIIFTGTGKRVADSFEGDAPGAPLLHIDYSQSNNNPPTAIDDAFASDEDTPLSGNVLAANPFFADSDPDGDPLTVTHLNGNAANVGPQIALPSGALVTLAANGSLSYDPAGQFDWLPAGQQTADQFNYTIHDGNGRTDVGLVTVTVSGVNDPPQASDDGGAGFTTDKSTPFTTATVLANDSDPDTGDTLTVVGFDASASSGLVVNNGDGTFNYNPNGQFDGLSSGQSATDTFTYTVQDGSGVADTATVTITVTAGNQPPVVENQTFPVDENAAVGTVVGTVLATDPDAGQTLSFQITQGNTGTPFAIHPASGVITVANSGPLDFEVTPSFALTVQVTDNGSPVRSDTATITVNLNDLEEPSGGTLDIRVAASTDDAEERTTGLVKLTSSDLELTFDRTEQIVGMRFNGVDAPPGAHIVNASVQFQVDETHSVATSLTIQAEAVDNALAFTSVSGNISSRPQTSASVAWSPQPWLTRGVAGPDQQTPNIAAVIQEIVNRPGWNSGNSLVVLITGTGERAAESYDGDVNGAPLLHLEYTTTASVSAASGASASSPTRWPSAVSPDSLLQPADVAVVGVVPSETGFSTGELVSLNLSTSRRQVFGGSSQAAAANHAPSLIAAASARHNSSSTDSGRQADVTAADAELESTVSPLSNGSPLAACTLDSQLVTEFWHSLKEGEFPFEE